MKLPLLLPTALTAASLVDLIVFRLLTGLIGPALLTLSRIVPVRIHILSILLLIGLR
jgi:hypothetical protein